jgi:predicted DNA-binding protein
MTPKIVISFRVPETLKEGLERLADADDRSLSNYIERVLKAHLDEAEAAEPPRKPGGKR